MKITFSPDVRMKLPGIALVAGQTRVTAGPSPEELVNNLHSNHERSAHTRFIMVAMRNLYWRTGIDPTKIRPSSEALWKAAVRGLRSINNVVDTCNLLSLRTGYPFSVFNAHKIRWPLTVDFAGDEAFTPVTHRVMRLKPGLLVVRDPEKIISAGYATADAYGTRVDGATTEVLYLIYVPPLPEDLGHSKKGSAAAKLIIDPSFEELAVSDPYSEEEYYDASVTTGKMMAEALQKWCNGVTIDPPRLFTA